jgi:Ca-activated chloride channel family protein
MGDEQQTQQQNESEEKGEEEHPQPLSRSERLEELNLTEEKARMILEAMKNSEIQYIQQNRRKPTKKPDSTKPDW